MSNSGFLGTLFCSYVIICSMILGQVLTPILFILWLFIGWVPSRYISDFFILGSETVKTSFTLFLYFGVAGTITLL
jgi:hypothetical protein